MLRAWRTRARLVTISDSALLRTFMSCMQSYLHAWRGSAIKQSKRRRASDILEMLQLTNIMRRMLIFWVDHVASARRWRAVADAIGYHQGYSTAASFEKWIIYLARRRRMKAGCMSLVQKWMDRALMDCVFNWKQVTAVQKRYSRSISMFDERKKMLTKTRSLQEWLQQNESTSHRTCQVVSILMVGEFDTVARSEPKLTGFDKTLTEQICSVLGIQSDNVQVLCHERGSADGTIIAHVVLTADSAREKSAGHGSQNSAVRLAKRLVRESVNVKGGFSFSKHGEEEAVCTAEVKGSISEAVLKSVKASMSQQRQSQCALEETKNNERNAIRSSRMEQRAAYRLLRKAYTTTFAKWHQLSRNCKRLRQRSKLLLQWIHRRRAKHIMQEWWIHVKTKRRLMKSAGKIVGHWLHRTVAMAYETWHEHAHEQGRMRGILRRIGERWLHREVAVAFVTWREGSDRQRRAEYITTRVLKHWSHRTAAAAFDGWRYWAVLNRKLARNLVSGSHVPVSVGGLAKCFGNLQDRFFVKVAFGRWNEFVVAAAADSYISHVTTCALAHFARVRRCTVMSVLFSSWKDFLESARYKQYLENLIFSQLNRSARTMKQSHFSAWSSSLEPDFESSGASEEDGGGILSDMQRDTMWGFDFHENQGPPRDSRDVVISSQPDALSLPTQNGLSLL